MDMKKLIITITIVGILLFSAIGAGTILIPKHLLMNSEVQMTTGSENPRDIYDLDAEPLDTGIFIY